MTHMTSSRNNITSIEQRANAVVVVFFTSFAVQRQAEFCMYMVQFSHLTVMHSQIFGAKKFYRFQNLMVAGPLPSYSISLEKSSKNLWDLGTSRRTHTADFQQSEMYLADEPLQRSLRRYFINDMAEIYCRNLNCLLERPLTYNKLSTFSISRQIGCCDFNCPLYSNPESLSFYSSTNL